MTDCHLHLQRFTVAGNDSGAMLSDVLQRAAIAGVENYVCCGTSPTDWDSVLQLAIQYPDRIIPCFGLHPWAAATAPIHWEKRLEDVLRAAVSLFGSRVGVGEIGLDKNCRRRLPSTVQEIILTTQLELARQFHLPVTLHCVGAAVQLTRVVHHWVRTSSPPFPPLILHGATHPLPFGGRHSGVFAWCSGDDVEQKLPALRMFYSISPVILDTNNTALRRWVAKLPVEQLLLESDSPNRSKLSAEIPIEPVTVAAVLREVATLRHVSVESLRRDCQKNVDRLFCPPV